MKRSWADLELQSIHKAIELGHELGSEEFISQTRFKESRGRSAAGNRQQAPGRYGLPATIRLRQGRTSTAVWGKQMRAILDRVGYQLVDMRAESFQGKADLTRVTAGPATKFWWANQSVNFDPVYGDGTHGRPLRTAAASRSIIGALWKTSFQVTLLFTTPARTFVALAE